MSDRQHVVIVGAGLAGSMMAIYLSRDGFDVDVYERRADMRLVEMEGGRSINLGLSARGIRALTQAGLADYMLERAVTMEGRVVHDLEHVGFHAYGTNHREVLNSIDRRKLNQVLMSRAEESGARFHFEKQCVDVDKKARSLTFRDATDGPSSTRDQVVEADLVIAADGAFSTVRQKLHKGERADFHQEFLPWGYKELTLPVGADGKSQVKLDALHVWPRGNALIVTHPNQDGSHTLTLFLPFEDAPYNFADLKTRDDVRRLFRELFPDLVPMMPELVDQFFAHTVGHLVTTRTAPWYYRDWAVLVGDACHAVFPFYGQGMNAALEDCVVLSRLIRDRRSGWEDVFCEFQARRKIHTDTLGELSKQNFLELSQRLRSPVFMLRKKADVVLSRYFPDLWKPLYSMVAHTTTPYADAVARARKQERILGAALGATALLGTGWLVGRKMGRILGHTVKPHPSETDFE